MFDEQIDPNDASPNAQCWDEIHWLQTLSNMALDLLAIMFDAYEEGTDCYEDPEDRSGHLGKAIHLDEDTFQRIADLLNEHRPRNAQPTTF